MVNKKGETTFHNESIYEYLLLKETRAFYEHSRLQNIINSQL